MKNQINYGYLSSFMMSLIMGGQYIFIKNIMMLADNEVFFVLNTRFTLAFFIFLLTTYLLGRKINFSVLKDKNLLSLSFLHPFINFTFQSIAVILLPVLLVSIFIAFIPIVNALIGHFFLKEEVSKKQWVLIILCVAGIMFLSIENFDIANNKFILLGIIFLLISITSRGFYSMKSRVESKKYSYIDITFVQLFFAFVIFNVIFLVSVLFKSYNYYLIFNNKDFIFGIIYLSVLASVVVFLLNNYALSKLSVTNMGLLNGLTSVVSSVSSVFVLKENINITLILGFLFVILANYFYPKFSK